MISYIKGELTEVSETSIVVETSSGIGMNIIVPQTVIDRCLRVGAWLRFIHISMSKRTL